MEAMGYYLVRGFIGCQWVGVAPCASSVGEEVGSDVLFAFEVLRCEAVVAVEDQCGQVSGYLLDCGVGQPAWSTCPDRKSHPIAEVLSPKVRMHLELSLAAFISSQIPTTIPRNSQRLLNRESP